MKIFLLFWTAMIEMEYDFTEEISKAYQRIAPYILKTPLLKCNYLSKMFNTSVWIKHENLQITGSFKLRGAANKLLILKQEGIQEVVTASSGNHGLAVAYMCKKLNIKAFIFIPNNCDTSKQQKIMDYGGDNILLQIIHHSSNSGEVERLALEFAQKNNLPYISPYNDYDIIFGQGTIGLEITKGLNCNFSNFPSPSNNSQNNYDNSNENNYKNNNSNKLYQNLSNTDSHDNDENNENITFDEIYIAVGGGGLVSGISSYVLKNKANKNAKIIGVQPENSAVLYYSLLAGRILDPEKKEVEDFETISDGTAGGVLLDSITFSICKKNVFEWEIIEEGKIKNEILEFMENEQLIIEGAAAMTIAALKKRLKSRIANKENLLFKHFCIVLCGRNISIKKIKNLLN